MTDKSTQEEAKRIWDQLEAEDRGETVTPEPVENSTETTAAEQSEAPVVEEKKTEEVDPAELIKKISSLEATLTQLTGRMRNAEGHIGGLHSTVKQQVETARRVQEAGAAAPSAKELSAAQGSPEAFAKLEEEYPEFAKAMKPALDAAVAAHVAELRKTLPQTAPQQENLLSKDELEQFKAELKIEQKHEGWSETVSGEEFKVWLNSAPYEVQMLAHSRAPEHAIRLLDLFKDSKKPAPAPEPEPKPSQRHANVAALPTGTRSAVRTKNVDDMTPQEYWAYLDQQEKLKA